MKNILISIATASILYIGTGCQDEFVKTSKSLNLLDQKQTLVKKIKKDSHSPHVVDEKTLVGWIFNWEKNRPADVDGKLIILQTGESLKNDISHSYIKHNDKNTFTYNAATEYGDSLLMFDKNKSADNISKSSLSQEMINWMLSVYDINPSKDMILVIKGGDKEEQHMDKKSAAISKFAWSLNHFGVKHYAVLDGNIQYLFDESKNPIIKELGVKSLDDIFVANPSIPPRSGTHTLDELKTVKLN